MNETDKYIRTFESPIQKKLQQLRAIIHKTAPEAIEVISYGMPAFKVNKVLVYFAAHKSHIGFYPTSSGIKAFEKKLNDYKWSKGAVQFPFDQPLPERLIQEMVKFRYKEDALLKKTPKKSS